MIFFLVLSICNISFTLFSVFDFFSSPIYWWLFPLCFLFIEFYLLSLIYIFFRISSCWISYTSHCISHPEFEFISLLCLLIWTFFVAISTISVFLSLVNWRVVAFWRSHISLLFHISCVSLFQFLHPLGVDISCFI
jgi:hypothetical protein